MKNLKKKFNRYLTLPAILVAGTMHSSIALAENIGTSADLVQIIGKEGEDTKTVTLTTDISLTELALGTLVGTELTIDGKKYNISGNGKLGITIGTGQKLYIVNVGSVDEDGNILTSWNGFDCHHPELAENDGGAIYSAGGNITITSSAFSGNRDEGIGNVLGGAIYAKVGTLAISGSTFSGNYNKNVPTTENPYAYGGAIYSGILTKSSISSSIFSGNYNLSKYGNSGNMAGSYGGAIYYSIGSNQTATLSGSTFSGNYCSATGTAFARAYGGAIYVYMGKLTITNSTFSGNYTYSTCASWNYSWGGAIYGGSLTIIDSTFSDNYTTMPVKASVNKFTRGGAIYNVATSNIISKDKDSIFSGNYTQAAEVKTNNDIYNQGTINLYAANEKTISFAGGIEGALPADPTKDNDKVNINVANGTTYDVTGTVIFKTTSISYNNNFTFGAGTLKLENGVTWTNNTLTQNGGTLDIGSSETGNIGTLEYKGGSLILNEGANINIDISGNVAGTGHDQIVFSEGAGLVLNGGKISVNLTYNAAVGEMFEIMTNFNLDGTIDPNCVNVSNAPTGWSSNRHFVASEGTGTDDKKTLRIKVVPEPSIFGLFAGLSALAGTRRRKKA